MVVQLLIFYFLILKSSDGLVVGIVTFGINSGAYVAELVRSGIALPWTGPDGGRAQRACPGCRAPGTSCCPRP